MAATQPTLPALPPGPTDTGSVAAADIRDARPPVAIPNLWTWLLGVALLCALAAAAFYAWRRYRREQQRPPPALVIPPYRRALEKLRAALDLLHDPERFCVAVSAAVRWFLEERFQLRAPERTTEEFLVELQQHEQLNARQRTLLGDFLTRCDLVKFARYEPAEPELRELHDAATRLVEETEPLLNPALPSDPPAPPAAPPTTVAPAAAPASTPSS
ncbi:MAG: DUF4381 family protein [Verrucomicrobiales bacterium]|nr:DUF4381 family protein [Verrucomicrobiales bacterium]